MDVVGREVELQQLEAWLGEALAGDGRLVLVAGEAGIGKTSLAAALVERAAGRGVTVAWGRSTEQAGAPPFWPWRQLTAALGAPTVLDPDQADDPWGDRFARFEALTAWLVADSRPGGTLVVLDDVHTADGPSLRLLHEVAGAMARARLAVVATHRDAPAEHGPGFAAMLAELARQPSTRRLGLTGLDRGAVAALLAGGTPGAVVDRVAVTTGGNPLYVRELARHLAGGGSPEAVPASVRDAVRARLDRVSPGCVEVLRVAAVVGREFPVGLVATALDRPVLACLAALDEAVGTGLVGPAGRPGHFRFGHIVVRDAVEATLGAAELPAVHRRVALAIEAYEHPDDDRLAALARHWDAASVLGERGRAADWCEQAAAAAERRLAWEDAARLFERAAALGGATEPVDRHRRLVGAARNRLHCDDVLVAVERCLDAAAAVRPLGRGELLAEAALVIEGRGGPDLAPLGDLAAEALALLDHDDAGRRSRLLGLQAAIAFYVDPEEVEALSAAALEAAATTDDPLAVAAAARARQMFRSTTDGAEECLELAARIGAAGRRLRRPSLTQWEPIWRIDALLVLGRLPEALAELAALQRLVAQAPTPVARWHLARVEALLAQATGRFADAERWGIVGRDLFATVEQPEAATAMWLGLRSGIALHTGWDDDLRAQGLASTEAPPFLGDIPLFLPIGALLGSGRREEASAIYDRMAPAASWRPPPFLRLTLHQLRVDAARQLGRVDDLRVLAAGLAAYRAYDVASLAGAVAYGGPVELWLGIAAAAIGDHATAVVDLHAALVRARASGARGFAVQAAVELAGALRAADAPGGDRLSARLLAEARPAALALGMAPWAARIDELVGREAPPDTGPLSRREAEVAALVAEGLTNRQIGTRLYLSERTAQNHVQHILTKLGFTSRSQIAAWHTRRR